MPCRTSIDTRNVELNAISALCNLGYLRIYSGAQPATPETAASGTLLAELRLNTTAFAAAAAGVLTANAITSDAAANNTGTAGWARVLRSDGTTVFHDGACGASGSGEQFEVTPTAITSGQPVDCTSYTYTLPE